MNTNFCHSEDIQRNKFTIWRSKESYLFVSKDINYDNDDVFYACTEKSCLMKHIDLFNENEHAENTEHCCRKFCKLCQYQIFPKNNRGIGQNRNQWDKMVQICVCFVRARILEYINEKNTYSLRIRIKRAAFSLIITQY